MNTMLGQKIGDLPRLLTPAQVAEILGRSRLTIYRKMARGEFRVLHDGRLRLIPLESVLAYIERLEQASN